MEVSDWLHTTPTLLKGKNTLYPLTRRLGVTQNWYGHFREQESLLSLPVALSLFLSAVVFACCQLRALFIILGSHHQHSSEYTG
jgi:hypothetical protein